jgi:hypothetical protein
MSYLCAIKLFDSIHLRAKRVTSSIVRIPRVESDISSSSNRNEPREQARDIFEGDSSVLSLR